VTETKEGVKVVSSSEARGLRPAVDSNRCCSQSRHLPRVLECDQRGRRRGPKCFQARRVQPVAVGFCDVRLLASKPSELKSMWRCDLGEETQ
jgi:hypothetical protein